MLDDTSSSLPERILVLAGQFTRHNDAMIDLVFAESPTAAALPAHIASAQRLARAAFDGVHHVLTLPLIRTLDVDDVLIRLRQTAFLTNAAADHLIDAQDILSTTEAEMAGGGDFDPHYYRDVLLDAKQQLNVAGDLTALAPDASAQAAEMLALALRRQRLEATFLPPTAGITLSAAQDSALRAIARGHVEVHDAAGRRSVSSHDDRLLLSTLKSLESKQLLRLRPFGNMGSQQRVQLNAAGRQALAATYGLPRPAALAAKAVPKTSNLTASVAHSR